MAKRPQKMTPEDRRLFIWGNVFFLGFDLLGIGCVWWATVVILTALEDIRNAASHVVVPVGTFRAYVAPVIIVAHIAGFFLNKWRPPRPRLQRVLTAAVFLVGIGGALAGWVLDRHVVMTAQQAGYQKCRDNSGRVRTLQSYAVDPRACPSTHTYRKN